MPTAPTTGSFRNGARIVAVVALASCCGCAGVGQRIENWCYGVTLWSQQKHELADVRQDTRAALAEQERAAMQVQAQREIEQARLDAERRRLESELCLARQQQEQRLIKEQMQHALESKVAFNVQQALEVGELEVDTEALKQLLEKREQEQKQPPTQPQEVPKRPCPCCDQTCGCGSGFVRRLCPHCRHKPCEAERDCGGPAMITQLQQQPQKQPLKPAEIPLKLPVRLSIGFQQPQIEQAQVRIQPPPVQEQRVPCDRCPRCAQPAASCQCPASCVDPAGVQGRLPPFERGQETSEPLPPMPEPDAEARRGGGGAGPVAEAAQWPVARPVSRQSPAYGAPPAGPPPTIAFPFSQLGNLQP
jgi:hypothetical protein